MLLKKFSGSLFILFSIFFIIISATSIDALATSLTIQTNFLDVNAVWTNKLDQVTNATTSPKNNTDIANSPYRVTMTNGSEDYTFLMSVGAYIPGTPDRVLFGAFSGTVTGYYNLDHSSLLTPFKHLTTTTRSAVIVLQDDLSYTSITSMTFSYAYGTRDDAHDLTVIYSFDSGVTWSKYGTAQSFTTGNSSQSISFNSLTLDHYTLSVGFLFENTFNHNNDAINMSNPQISIEATVMTDSEQAQQFASQIEDYSPCASIDNGMIQLTETKKNEFIDRYTRLSNEAKTLLTSISMGEGFTALDRYQYLINS
jgi:hypothetical protein